MYGCAKGEPFERGLNSFGKCKSISGSGCNVVALPRKAATLASKELNVGAVASAPPTIRFASASLHRNSCRIRRIGDLPRWAAFRKQPQNPLGLRPMCSEGSPSPQNGHFME